MRGSSTCCHRGCVKYARPGQARRPNKSAIHRNGCLHSMRAALACRGRNYTVFHESDCQRGQIYEGADALLPKTNFCDCRAIFSYSCTINRYFFTNVFLIPSCWDVRGDSYPPRLLLSPLPALQCRTYSLYLSHVGFGVAMLCRRWRTQRARVFRQKKTPQGVPGENRTHLLLVD